MLDKAPYQLILILLEDGLSFDQLVDEMENRGVSSVDTAMMYMDTRKLNIELPTDPITIASLRINHKIEKDAFAMQKRLTDKINQFARAYDKAITWVHKHTIAQQQGFVLTDLGGGSMFEVELAK